MADENLEVDPREIATYANHLQFNGPTKVMAASAGTFTMLPLVNSALGGMAGSAGAMPEAEQLAYSIKDLNGRYQQFLTDVGRGLTAIGNAAMVCALTYNNTDAASADQLGLVNFAFQQPGNYERPEGLPPDVGDETLADVEAANGRVPGQPESVTGEGGTTIYVGNGSITSYRDGSSESRFPGPMINGQPSTVTTLTGPGGVVLQTSTTAGGTDDRTQIVTMPGVAGGPPSTVTTRTVVEGDTVRVTTTSRGPQVNEETGEITEVTGSPVTTEYDRSDVSGADEQPGPLEELQREAPDGGAVFDWRVADQVMTRLEREDN